MSHPLTRRDLLIGVSSLMFARIAAGVDRFRDWPFYAMDTGLVGPDVSTLAEKIALVKELGFAGLEYTLSRGQLPELLQRLDAAGLQLEGVYTTPTIDSALDPKILDLARLLKGRPTRIEMALSSKKFKQSDKAGDGAAIDLIRRLSDACSDTGPCVSVYPHTGNWAERVEDGVRLASAIGRSNVGTNFNLVHWKWVNQKRHLEEVLREAIPYLKLVTINGLAGRQIVSLDQGDYDIAGFLKLLRSVGYVGPIGLQGYGINGPSRSHLSASMNAWRKLSM